MLRLQHTIIAHLTIVLVLVNLLLPTSSANAATLDRPQTQAKAVARSPLTLLLTASSTGIKTIKLTITLETPVALDDIKLKLGVASGLTLVSTTLPTQTVLIAGQRLTYDAVVNINDAGPQDVEVLAWGSHANRVFTQLASLRLETVAGKITSRPSPARANAKILLANLK